MKRLHEIDRPLLPLQGLRQLIVDSWNRCQAAGLHPSDIRWRKIAGTDLARRLDANRVLIEAARSRLEQIAMTMAGIPHAVCLTDAEGIVLFAITSDPMNKPRTIAPGCDWSETAIGTNGAGTAIAANQPVAIVGLEHYARAWSGWTCTGAPVHAPDGSVIAAIDASTSAHGDCHERLQLVTEAARRIESEYARRRLADAFDRPAVQPFEAIGQLCDLAHAIVRDFDGTIRFWSAQGLYGWSSQQALGMISHELLATVFPRPLREIDQLLLRDGFWTGELGHTAKSGRRITVSSHWAVLRDSNGSVSGVVEINNDITELKTAYRILQENDRHKDEFLSMLAHEIRNPLAAITSARDLLEALLEKKLRQGDVLAIIDRQVKHLSRLADDLIDLQQINKGKFDYRPEPVRLSAIIRGAIEIAQPKISDRQQKLIVTMPQDDIQLSGDCVRLIQAVSNLLDNATKYTPEGGMISLAVEREEHQVIVRVRDNGIGIPPDLLPGIFELYTQSARQGAKSPEGLGVGLALVKSIVLVHGGEVEAFSEGLGQGSEFVVRLPVPGRQNAANKSG
jgi:PAS domain S-box-containing protein